MATSVDARKEELLETDDEFRRLHQEHQSCEERLEELYGKSALSEEDEMEQKRIKLHKLALKDRMEQIARRGEEAGVSA